LTETYIWVPVDGDAVGVFHKSTVVRQTLETLVEGDDGTIALAESGDVAYGLINSFVAEERRVSLSETSERSQNIQSIQLRSTDERAGPRLIENTKHHDDIPVLGLRDEFCDDPDIVQSPLRIDIAHGTKKEVRVAESSGMVPSVL
jgi:hypothetical protein